MVLLLLFAAVGHVSASVSTEGKASPRSASYLLSIVAANATRWVDASTPQKSATFGFQVQNTGDSNLPNCDLQLYPWTFPPDKWSYNFIPSAPFEVPPNQGPKTILLVIYPSADADAKRYTFQLKGKGLGVVTNSISINLDVRQYANVKVKAPPVQAANPGETLEFDFEIQNTGNGKDKFFVFSVEASITSIVPVLKDGLNWTNDLAPTKSAIKTVVVELQYNTKTTEGTAGLQLTMTVRSNFNITQDDVNWTYIQVYHTYDLSLGISPPSATLLPGELAEFTITLLNLGNGNDNISVNVTTTFDSSSWTVGLGKPWFYLAAERTNTTTLKITPPLNALKGSNYRIDVTATSSGPLFPDTPVQRTESLAITIKQVRKLDVPVQNFTAPAPIGPGEVVRFPFSFTNMGNGEDTVNITVIEKPVNWFTTLDFFQNIRLQPFTKQDVSLTVQASINRNESQHQSYYVKLQIVNSDRSSRYNLTFEIPIKPVYDWDFSVQEPSTGSVNPFARAEYSFSLVFVNSGNIDDDIMLTLGGDYTAWGKLDTNALSLAYGEQKVVRLAVDVPRSAEVGPNYGVKVTATSQNNPALTKEVLVTVVVVHMDVSVVPADSIEINQQVWNEYKTALGTSLNITVTVRNDGSDSVRGVNVQFFDNDVLFAERNTSTISPLKTAKFTVPWTAAALGVHVLRVKVDPANILGEVNFNNNEGVSTIMVKKYVAPSSSSSGGTGWLYPLVVMVLIVVAVAVAYVVYQRRPKYDKELYESIYGQKSNADAEAMAAERAEVERRAREKSDEGYVPSMLYEEPAHEEVYAPQPATEASGTAPVTGPSLNMDATPKIPAASSPGAPAAPKEGPMPVLKPAPKKKITIRPVEKK
jgi:uncharacterized membrane protein